MKKNLARTIRVNDEVMRELERGGWSAQRLFDWAIQQKVDVQVKVQTRVKLKKPR